jgi:sugar phosphate isomerase/epimerase
VKLGVFAKTFPQIGAMSVLGAVAAAGYECTQYNMSCSGLAPMPDALPDNAAWDVAAAAEANDVTIVAVSGTYNMIHPDKAVREAGQRRLRVLAGCCKAMATGLITLCTGTRDTHDQWAHHPANNDLEAWRDLLHEMERAAETAEEFDIALGIEPELANVVNSSAKARKLLDEVKSRRLKIVFDPANLFEVATLQEQRRLVSEGVDILAKDIVLAHAKDRTGAGEFVAAGQGILDYAHFLRALRHSGFYGPLITHGLAAREAADVARFLKQHLAVL